MTAKLTVLAIATALAIASSARSYAQQPNWSPSSYANPGETSYVSTAQVSDTIARTTVSDSANRSDNTAGCTDAAAASCGGCGQCRACRRSTGIWGGVEYLQVWTKGRDVPALVSTSPLGTPQISAGVLPGANVLFGQDGIGRSLQSGARLTAGIWLDDCDCTGVGVRFLGIEGDRTNFLLGSDANSNPIIARPYFNVDPLVNAQDALLVSFPGLVTGNVDVRTSNDVYSMDTFLRINLDRDSDFSVDLIGGYHFTLVDDGLTVRNVSQVVGGLLPIGTIFDFRDAFNARNEFHGGEIGLMGNYGCGLWTLNMLAKISIGRNYETVTINGQTTVIDVGGGVANAAGGLLAQPTNIGTYQKTETVYIPEAMISLNRRLNDHWDISIGYSFLYWSSVSLAGNQVQSVGGTPIVNGSQLNGGALIGPPAPQFTFVDTDFWLHSLNFGLNFRY